MSSLPPEELLNFLKSEIVPLEDSIYGKLYRASANLIDGTFLPCVIFQSQEAQVQLAMRRFESLRNKLDQYKPVVSSFVAGGNKISDYEIKSVEPSIYAWPLETIKKIEGETTMAWTAFVVEMKDGALFSYGTTFRMDFFDLPEGYKFTDISRIHSGKVFLKEQGIIDFSHAAHAQTQYFREKPFFKCFLKGLPAPAPK